MIWINQDVYFPFLILSVPQIELLVAEIKLGSYREEEKSEHERKGYNEQTELAPEEI